MVYDYASLKVCAEKGAELGTWKKQPVYSISKRNIQNIDLNNGNAYIIYDDGNKLWYQGNIVGTVNKFGNVDQWRKPQKYYPPEEEINMDNRRKYVYQDPVEAKEVKPQVPIDGGLLLEEILKETKKMLDEACKW